MKYCTTILALFISSIVYAQTLAEKKLIDQISFGRLINIYMTHGAERYERTEVCVIYHSDSFIRIHCILTSNSASEKNIDTVFYLTSQQCEVINEFGRAVDLDKIPSHNIIAGSYSKYLITVNGETKSISNKSDYSLVSELLNIDY